MNLINSKNSQYEGIGLLFALVVGLIFAGFMLRDFYTQKPESPQKEYITDNYANDVIDVTIRTNSENCRGKPGLSFKDLVQDCEANLDKAGISCDPNDKDSPIRTCNYAKQEISWILNKFLKENVGVDYYFVIFTGSTNEHEGEVLKWDEPRKGKVPFKIGSILDASGNPQNCPSNTRSKTYQLPSISGTAQSIFIKLNICLEPISR